jgi:membrane protein implicated in regulation of membrane protease activity
MPWWGWVVVGVLFLGAEIFLSTDFYLFFFGAMGLVMGLIGLAGVGLPAWAQFLIYAALSIVSLVLFRRRIRGMFLKPDADVGDSLVGHLVTAKAGIAPGDSGQVELRGSVWAAHNVGTQLIDAGQRCPVVRVEGVTLFVRSSAEEVPES